MIIGVGTDLVDIRRIEQSLARFGDRFVDRIFTDIERAKAYARPDPAAAFAQRFAAKEACAKALGTGFRVGVFMRDIGVHNMTSGKPYLVLRGGALRRLTELTPAGETAAIDLSLTDEYPMAHAMVVISSLPGG